MHDMCNHVLLIKKLLRLCCKLCLNRPSALTSRAKSLGVFLCKLSPGGEGTMFGEPGNPAMWYEHIESTQGDMLYYCLG